MKKQRWRWTKQLLICPMCFEKLKDSHFKRYGVCSNRCGKMKYGLDFNSNETLKELLDNPPPPNELVKEIVKEYTKTKE